VSSFWELLFLLDNSFNFMFNLGSAKLVFCCFIGVCYVDVGKLVEFYRRIADFLVDLARPGVAALSSEAASSSSVSGLEAGGGV
jgi:hypothetical protein